MTLDDFFTLTEMNNGLMAPSRVRELMTVMQKERDCNVRNAADATRQWSAVARAISATGNKDCLDIFIQLDGLHFISKWLKDAQKLNEDMFDSFVEESVVRLLQVLEKLCANYDDLIDSGIWTTVQHLFVHNSTKVQDTARLLFESWKTNRSLSDVEKLKPSIDVGTEKGADTEQGVERLESSTGEPSTPRDDPVVSANSDSGDADQVKSENSSEKIIDPPTEGDRLLDRLGSPSSPKPTMEPGNSIGSTSESCNPTVSRLDTVNTITEFHGKQSPMIESSPERLTLVEGYKTPEDKNGDKKLRNDGLEAIDDARSVDSEEKGDGDSGFSHSLSRKSSSSDRSWGNAKDLETLISASDAEDGKLSADGTYNHLASTSNFGKTQLGRKPVRADEKTSYGIFDPLEFARQVAMEVERDYREDSCSSSEKLPKGNIPQPSWADSVEFNEVAKSSTSSKNLDGVQTNGIGPQDTATSQATIAADEETNIEKAVSNFDLNEVVCLEDAEHRGNIFPASVSIVSASRAAASPGLPSSPLQFEGTLGWKGSAATSAFRPASSRYLPERNKDCSLRLRQGHLDFDLNVTENIVGASQDKQAQLFSSLPSGESSAETSSRRSEHLAFDLNHASEEGTAPSDGLISQFLPGKFHDNHSYSLSTSKQPIRDIDMNDQPSFLNGAKVSSNFNLSSSAISIMGRRVEVNRNDFVPQAPLIPRGRTPELALDLNLGRTKSSSGIRSVPPFPHSSPVYSYNIAPGPGPTIPSSAVYTPGGLIPYMIDSRGTPVLPPQIMGSASPMSRPPFVVNMNASTPPSSSYPNSGGLGLFLNSTQFRSMEQPNHNIHIPMNSAVMPQKRKEPDNGWDQYPFKHVTQPWKHG